MTEKGPPPPPPGVPMELGPQPQPPDSNNDQWGGEPPQLGRPAPGVPMMSLSSPSLPPTHQQVYRQGSSRRDYGITKGSRKWKQGKFRYRMKRRALQRGSDGRMVPRPESESGTAIQGQEMKNEHRKSSRYRQAMESTEGIGASKMGTSHGKRPEESGSLDDAGAVCGGCRLLDCAQKAMHTGSVVVTSVVCDNVDDEIVTVEEVTTKEEKRKQKKIKKKGEMAGGTTRVVTSSVLPSPPADQRCFAADRTMKAPLASTVPDSSSHAVVHVQPLLVLDLNGILCHRIRSPTSTASGTLPPQHPPRFREQCGVVANTPVVPRTDLVEFVTMLDENFTLAVWTSAKRRTAKTLVKMLFPEEISKRLLFVWGQNWCDARRANKDGPETTTLSHNPPVDSAELASVGKSGYAGRQSVDRDSSYDTIFIKSLSKVWNSFPLWDSSNTILIDDSPEKCPPLFLKNAIHPPPILGRALPSSSTGSVGFAGIAGETPDEINEENQRNFFQQLARHWMGKDEQERGIIGRESTSAATVERYVTSDENNSLELFLYQYGRGHMGWRGSV